MLLKRCFENAIYRLQMAESMRKRMLCDLVRSEKRLKTKVASPGYVKCVIVNDQLVVVERKKPVICLNRPLFVACTILDVAKVRIFKIARKRTHFFEKRTHFFKKRTHF